MAIALDKLKERGGGSVRITHLQQLEFIFILTSLLRYQIYILHGTLPNERE